MLSVDNLSVRYGSSIALDAISLDMDGAHIVGIMGTNGAGKSSLGTAIAGLVKYSGVVRLEGQRLDGKSAADRVKRGVVYVPEGRRIFATLSVVDNLRAGAFSARENWRARVDELFDRMPTLAKRSSALGGLLSGGEQQLLAIARALMARPRVLILDEPSLGLSPLGVREVQEVLTKLVEQDGLHILLLEQNVMFTSRLAERAWILRLGKLVARLDRSELSDAEHIRDSLLGTSSAILAPNASALVSGAAPAVKEPGGGSHGQDA